MVGAQGPKGALVHDDVVGFGSQVTIEDLDTGARTEHRLMAGDAMDLDAGHISTDSPLGMALLGRSVGDVVEVATPLGTRRLRVVDLQTLPAFLDAMTGGRAAATKWRAPRQRTGTYG